MSPVIYSYSDPNVETSEAVNDEALSVPSRTEDVTETLFEPAGATGLFVFGEALFDFDQAVFVSGFVET